MFFDQYQKAKEIFEKRENKINQPITIQNLFVYPHKLYAQGSGEEFAYGESELYARKANSFNRLVDYIAILAGVTNQYHQKFYCRQSADGTYSIKEDCLNKITRLCLPEFALYTVKPFSLDELSQLTEALQDIAKHQLDNVHLLLCSIPVVTKEKYLLNMCLYVQCGSHPFIEIFSKGRASSADIVYHGVQLFSQRKEQVIDTDELKELSQEEIKELERQYQLMSAFVSSESGQAISCNTLFTVKTLGGAFYVQAIDICLDHKYEHAKQLMEQVATSINDMTLIPNQVDHILTSNTIKIKTYAKVSKKIIHIDPSYPRMEYYYSMKHDPLKTEDFAAIKSKYSHHLSIEKTEEGFILIKFPPFGETNRIIAIPEKPVAEFSYELKPVIKHHNEHVKKHMIAMNVMKNDEKEYQKLLAEKEEMSKKLDKLLHALLRICQVNCLESLCKTQNYHIKNQARLIIQDYFDTFSSLMKYHSDPILFVYETNKLLKDLIVRLQEIRYGTHSIVRRLTSTIEKILSESQEMKFQPKK